MTSIYDQRPWTELYEPGSPREITPETRDCLELFRGAVRDTPQRTALTYFDGALSYADVEALSDALAAYLVARGFQRGDRIALYLQNVPQFALGVLAGWKAGGIVVPVNPMYRRHELDKLFGDARPTAIVCLQTSWWEVVGEAAGDHGVRIPITTSELDFQQRHDARLFAGAERYRDPATDDLVEIVESWRGHQPDPLSYAGGDIALLTYTSGTSGTPKGATNTHGNIAFNALAARANERVPDGGGIFALAPLFHITGMVVQFATALAVRGTLHLAHRFEPGVVLDALLEHRPYFMVGPSTAYMALANHPDVNREHFASLGEVNSGGAPLPSAVVESFRERFGHYIRNGYGLTETSATATSVPAHREAPVDADSGTISVGVPNLNTVLRIVDDSGEELSAGEVGEIVIEGPMVVPAYWNRPEDTAESIPDGRLFTGDVGFMDEQGWFYVVDRKKDMINASGYKVWPREVEDVLYGHPAVREAAVVGVPDTYRGETVRAYVSLKSGAAVSGDELARHCKGRLAAYKYPREVEVLEDLPKTLTGKILRRELRDGAARLAAAEGGQRSANAGKGR